MRACGGTCASVCARAYFLGLCCPLLADTFMLPAHTHMLIVSVVCLLLHRMEEGDVVGLFAGPNGAVLIDKLCSENAGDAVVCGVISRSAHTMSVGPRHVTARFRSCALVLLCSCALVLLCSCVCALLQPYMRRFLRPHSRQLALIFFNADSVCQSFMHSWTLWSFCSCFASHFSVRISGLYVGCRQAAQTSSACMGAFMLLNSEQKRTVQCVRVCDALTQTCTHAHAHSNAHVLFRSTGL